MRRIIVFSLLLAALMLFGTAAPAADQPVRRPVSHTMDLHLDDTVHTHNYELGLGVLFIPGTATFRPSYGLRVISQYVGLGPLLPRFSFTFAYTSKATTGSFRFEEVTSGSLTLEALVRPPNMKFAPYGGLGISYLGLNSSADGPYYNEIGPYDDKTAGATFALGSDVTWQATAGVMAGKPGKVHTWMELTYLPAMPRMKVIRTIDARTMSFFEEYEYPRWRLSLGITSPL